MTICHSKARHRCYIHSRQDRMVGWKKNSTSELLVIEYDQHGKQPLARAGAVIQRYFNLDSAVSLFVQLSYLVKIRSFFSFADLEVIDAFTYSKRDY